MSFLFIMICSILDILTAYTSFVYISLNNAILNDKESGSTRFWGWKLGMANMHNTKRIMISLPDHLLQEVDGIVAMENSNRSELIRQAMKLYLNERKKRFIRESMQRGYMEMAKINLSMASEAFHAEEDADITLDRLVSGV